MATATQEKMACSCCGNALDGEELENPQIDRRDDQPICDECFHEHFEFTCCDCCNYGDVDDQHNMLVVFNSVSSMGGPTREVAPGIYKIAEDGSYFGGPIIGSGYLYGDHLERIADVNPDMDGNGYPCGHLCLNCQQSVLAQFTGVCWECQRISHACLEGRFGKWVGLKPDGDRFRNAKFVWSEVRVVCAECRHRLKHFEREMAG